MPRKQKRRKGSLIISLLMKTDLIERMDVAVAEQNRNTRKAPLNRSEWIRRAIERDLDHINRSRGRKAMEAAVLAMVKPYIPPTLEEMGYAGNLNPE